MERSPSQATTHETPAVDKHTITDLSPLTWRGICDASLTIVIQDAEKKVWAMRQFRAIRWCTHLTAHSKSGESGVKQATKKKKPTHRPPTSNPPWCRSFWSIHTIELWCSGTTVDMFLRQKVIQESWSQVVSGRLSRFSHPMNGLSSRPKSGIGATPPQVEGFRNVYFSPHDR